MGQKSSKKNDLYVTDDVTHCKLPPEAVTKYVGRAREYTAIDVVVKKTEDDSKAKENGDGKKKSPAHEPPNSIIQLLARAHRKSYNLAFIVPKIKGSKSTKLNRNSLVGEESPEKTNDKENTADLTHTVFLWRPKVKSRVKKEQSLKKMEAKKTFLNLMMDIQSKWIFSVKEFECETLKIESGECVSRLQEMISVEAGRGGRLLSVMRADHDLVKENGLSNGNTDGSSPKSMPKRLTLRMVFIHRNSENPPQRYIYDVKCVNMHCTEEKIKVKKKQKTKLPRDTNVTWSENWLDLFEEDSRVTEVINVGELNPPNSDQDSKSKKKLKKREFQVTTLCFHEKPVSKDSNDNNGVSANDDEDDDIFETPKKFESLVREVWAPIDDTVHQSLEAEAEKFGENGWELCTVLVTSHVRMKSDGSEFRKCAIFFQRPKAEYVPDNEKDKSTEDLIQDGNVAIEEATEPETEMLEPEQIPAASPKEKVERFGYALMPQVNLNEAKLRAPKTSPHKSKASDEVISGIAAVQLKKVNREETKKTAPASEDKPPMMPQIKLRKTEAKQEKKEEETGEQNVPWMSSLERKRNAVMKTEEKPKEIKPDEGADEIAKKIDEIKEKRAQRQKRVSLHREEEKRKSLQEEEKRKSLQEEEKRKSLQEEAKRSSIQEDAKEESASKEELSDAKDDTSQPESGVSLSKENVVVGAIAADVVAGSVEEETKEEELPPLPSQEETTDDSLPPPPLDDSDDTPPPVVEGSEVCQATDGDKEPLPPPLVLAEDLCENGTPEEAIPLPPQKEQEAELNIEEPEAKEEEKLLEPETIDPVFEDLEHALADFEEQLDVVIPASVGENDLEKETAEDVPAEESPKKEVEADKLSDQIASTENEKSQESLKEPEELAIKSDTEKETSVESTNDVIPAPIFVEDTLPPPVELPAPTEEQAPVIKVESADHPETKSDECPEEKDVAPTPEVENPPQVSSDNLSEAQEQDKDQSEVPDPKEFSSLSPDPIQTIPPPEDLNPPTPPSTPVHGIDDPLPPPFVSDSSLPPPPVVSDETKEDEEEEKEEACLPAPPVEEVRESPLSILHLPPPPDQEESSSPSSEELPPPSFTT